MRVPKIDAHHHLWEGPLPWMGSGMDILRRPHLPPEFEMEAKESGIGGSIVVQAQQGPEETSWLIGLARQHGIIKGVVGWADLKDPGVCGLLEGYVVSPAFRGVREITQGEPPDKYLTNNDFNRGVDTLKGLGITYDILIYHDQLATATGFVDRHPNQTFILDHIGKPDIRSGRIRPWMEQLKEIAKRPNVFCKLSGLVTESGEDWNASLLEPYMDAALGAFGSQRLMFGSDWPVCRLRCEYKKWHDTAAAYLSRLSLDEQTAIFGGNAIKAYGLRI